VQQVPAFGPHQYLAKNERGDRVYATSWALPPALSSWSIERADDRPWTIAHLNTAPISAYSERFLNWQSLERFVVAATSSYISLPLPYTHLYSAGGPTGEVHIVDPVLGGFGEKVQQILFLPEDQLEQADKSRAALVSNSVTIDPVFLLQLRNDPPLCFVKDSGTALMPLKFRRRAMRSYPFCTFSSPHCLTVSHTIQFIEEQIRSVCIPSITNPATSLCSLIPRAQENKTVHGMSSSRRTAGFYTVLPNTVNLDTFFVYLLILLLHSQPALSTFTTSPTHLSSTSSRSPFFHLNRILLTTAATLFVSALLLRSLHPQLTYSRLLEAPTPHTKGSSPYSPSSQLDYSAPTNRKPRDGRPLLGR